MKVNRLKNKVILLIIVVLIVGVGIYHFGKKKPVQQVRKDSAKCKGAKNIFRIYIYRSTIC